jgi:hypothetical protein
MAGQNYCVVGGCHLSLSLGRRGFQDLLKVRPSSMFISCGCISSSTFTYLPMKMEQTEGSETSAYKIPKPGNYPEENTTMHCTAVNINL